MNKPRAIVLVPDGVGVRNFVIGRFLNEMARVFQAHVFDIIPEAVRPAYAEAVDHSVRWMPLIPYRQSHLALLLQESLGYAHMYWANTHAMRRALARRTRGPMRSRIFMRAARAVGRTASAAGAIDLLDRVHCRVAARLPEFRRYREIFARQQ